MNLFPFNTAACLKAHRNERGVSNFLVTSWGHSGSIWLAGSLNLHDRVFSSVGVDHPLISFETYDLNKDFPSWKNLPDSVLFRHGCRAHKYRDRTIPIGKHGRDIDALPHYLFDELEELLGNDLHSYSVLGNVHGTTMDQMSRILGSTPNLFDARPIIVLDLIRHPLSRTESAIKATINYTLEALRPAIDSYLANNVNECLSLERRYGIDFSEPRTRASLHVFRQGIQNDVWASELINYPHVERILMERLQYEPEYFSSVFYILSQGTEVADKVYLDNVFSEENLSSGRQTPAEKHTRTLTPSEQYQRWSAWEREEFARIADRLNIPRLYFNYGYDFSFLDPRMSSTGTWVPTNRPSRVI